MTGLALNADNDIFFEGGSSIRSRDGAYVAQRVLTYLQTFQGENASDATYGIPYLTQTFISQKDIPVVLQMIRDGILSIDEVTSINSFSSEYDGGTRHLDINFSFSTVYETVELSNYTLNIGG